MSQLYNVVSLFCVTSENVWYGRNLCGSPSCQLGIVFHANNVRISLSFGYGLSLWLPDFF